MQAAVVTAINGPWEVKEVPRPEPGTNQVLVKMHASGICYTDVHQTLGHVPGAFPRILGHEPVGEVVAVAAGVTSRKVGDRVGVPWIQSTCGRCEWCARGRKMFCAGQKSTGMDLQGGHAEYMPMYADATFLIPDECFLRASGAHFLRGLHRLERSPLGPPSAPRACRRAGHRGARASRRAIRQSCRLSHHRDFALAR